MSEKNCYELLGISPTASQVEIDEACRKMERLYAPANNASPFAEKLYAGVTKAGEILRDASSRAVYDAEHPELFREKIEPAQNFVRAPEEFNLPPLRREAWEGPETVIDEETDFTPMEYLRRPAVPLVAVASIFVIFAFNLVFSWMDPSETWRLLFRTICMVGAAWGGYFALRLNVISKGWLPIYIMLCAFAYNAFNYFILMEKYTSTYRRASRDRSNIIVLFACFFFVCFSAAAIFLEKGDFMENLRNLRKLSTGRFNKPE